MGEEMRELRSTNRWLLNSHGSVKYSIGNGVAKELIHMTLDMNNCGGLPEGAWGAGWREAKEEK